MRDEDVLGALHEFIAREVLDGEDVGLDESTPLIELGVLNSMEILRLIGFIEERFGASVPADKVLPDNFKNLTAIKDLVLALKPE